MKREVFMEKKIDYTKDYKELYLPKTQPVIIDVCTMPFIMIDGKEDPNKEEFQKVVEALYGFSYTIKMSYKTKDVPPGYYEYKVFPLEGVWDLGDTKVFDKDNFVYTMMIRQPDFVTHELFEKTREILDKKKPNPYIGKAVFGTVTEGLCCQMMHIGSYGDEPASFERMTQFCISGGYRRASMTHREIYLSDPRRTDISKLKTVLTFKVEKV